ncbi:MAG: hypothetical protein LBT77_00130 [Mycoplasmataceae bacterium]|jgi:hypothetical protein|nr:hypothetical protein [Mycoplasmataceae bacterium]
MNTSKNIIEQTKKLSDIDFSRIPTSDEFQKIKIKPPSRWYNTLMSLTLATTGICVGAIIAILIVKFS